LNVYMYHVRKHVISTIKYTQHTYAHELPSVVSVLERDEWALVSRLASTHVAPKAQGAGLSDKG